MALGLARLDLIEFQKNSAGMPSCLLFCSFLLQLLCIVNYSSSYMRINVFSAMRCDPMLPDAMQKITPRFKSIQNTDTFTADFALNSLEIIPFSSH